MSGQKNYCWTWIAVDRFAGQFIPFVCGNRGTETGVKLYNNISHREVPFTVQITENAMKKYQKQNSISEARQKPIQLKGIIAGLDIILHRLEEKASAIAGQSA